MFKPVFLVALFSLTQSVPICDSLRTEEKPRDPFVIREIRMPNEIWVRSAIKSMREFLVKAFPKHGKYAEINPETLTDKQRKCLALNVYHEARGESIRGQEAVIHVTLNRLLSDRYPGTICEVVYQPWQFSWTMDKLSDVPKESAAWARAKRLVDEFIGRMKFKKDFTNGAMWYHADYVRPKWRLQMIKVVQIDRHIFYRV